MEQEFLQLAQEAVGALKATPPAPPVDIAAWAQVWVTAGVGLGQLLLIAWGLRQMGKASQDRNRQLDMMEAAQRKQTDAMTQAFTQQGEVLAELLRRTA